MADKITFKDPLTQKLYVQFVQEVGAGTDPQLLVAAVLMAIKTTLELHVTDDEWEVEFRAEEIEE